MLSTPCWAQPPSPDTYNIQRPIISGGVVTCNLLIAPYCRIAVTQAITTLNLNFPADATPYVLEFDQDAVGHNITLPGNLVSSIGGPIGSPQTAANSTTVWNFLFNEAANKFFLNSNIALGSGGIGGSTNNVPGTDNVINVANYGAKPDNGVTDNTAAFQSAINAVVAGNSLGSGTVYIPPTNNNFYQLLSPLLITTNGIHIMGGGRNASVVREAGVGGYLFNIQGKAVAAFPTTTALLTGSAAASALTGSNTDPFLELRDLKEMNLNGLSAMTVEAFVNMNSTSAFGNISSCAGQHASTDPQLGAYQLSWNNAIPAVSCSMTINGTLKSANGGTLTPGTTSWVGCSYDGSNLRLYVAAPGAASVTPVATTAATGPITQQAWENCTYGGRYVQPIDEQQTIDSANAKIDGFRVSKIARYTGTLTNAPSATLPTCDGNCLVEWNGGSANGGNIVKVATKDGTGYLIPRTSGFLASINDVQVDNMTIEGTGLTNGLFVQSCNSCTFRNLNINTANGMLFINNSFESYLDNILLQTSGWFDQGYVNAAGLIQANHVQSTATAALMGTVFSGGSLTMIDWVFTEESTSVLPLELISSGGEDKFTCIGCAANNENGSTAQVETTHVMGTGNSGLFFVSFINSEMDTANSQQAFVLDNLKAGSFKMEGGGIFDTGGSPASEVGFIGSTTGVQQFDSVQSATTLVSDANSKFVRTEKGFTAGPNSCNGTVTLSGGTATVNAGCFTSTDIINCVDMTQAQPSGCAPSNGSLSVGGYQTDTIYYHKVQ